MGLGLGVVAFNALMTAVGYCLLAPALRGLRAPPAVRGLRARTLASYAGLALLAGTCAIGVALCVAAPFGAHIGVVAVGIVAAVLAAGGLAAARLLPRAGATPLRAPWPDRLVTDVVATAAAFGLVALGVLVLVGGFRSAAWLDDTWYFWLPKGRALDLGGLDPRLWTPNPHLTASYGDGGESLTFIRPDNPLWWSIVLNAVTRFVGRVDLRAVNAEMAFLFVAFAGSLARLLWGRVRAEILFPALLVALAAPELLRQAQSGAADVPLAFTLALAVLCGAGWLAERSWSALALCGLFAAAAIAIKAEGLPLVLLAFAVLSAAGWRAGRPLVALWVAVACAVLADVPWLVWRHIHHVADVFSLRDALTPSYLSDRTGQLHEAVHVLGRHFGSVHEWSLVVPLVAALSLAAAVRRRDVAWLGPLVWLGLAYALFVWVSWADPQGVFRLVASAYRYVTAPIVLAGAFLPLLAEALVRRPSAAAE